jgi:hypothetical protein
MEPFREKNRAEKEFVWNALTEVKSASVESNLSDLSDDFIFYEEERSPLQLMRESIQPQIIDEFVRSQFVSTSD